MSTVTSVQRARFEVPFVGTLKKAEAEPFEAMRERLIAFYRRQEEIEIVVSLMLEPVGSTMVIDAYEREFGRESQAPC